MQNDMSWLTKQVELKMNIPDLIRIIKEAQAAMVARGKTNADAKNITFTLTPRKPETVKPVPQQYGGIVVRKGVSFQKMDSYSISKDKKNPNTGEYETVYFGNGYNLVPQGGAPQVAQPMPTQQPVAPTYAQPAAAPQPLSPQQQAYPAAQAGPAMPVDEFGFDLDTPAQPAQYPTDDINPEDIPF